MKKRQHIIANINENFVSIRKFIFSSFNELPKGSPTFSQLNVMIMINKQKVKTIKDISNTIHITPPAATQFVNELVKKKLILRKVDKDDKRQINLELTSSGNKILNELEKNKMKFMTKIFKVFNDSELEEMDKLQKKLLESLGVK